MQVISGPPGATIEPVTGIFSWEPAIADIGRQLDVTVRLGDDVCGDGSYVRWTDWKEFVVNVGACDPVEFVPNQLNKFLFRSGQDLHVTLQVQDDDPVNRATTRGMYRLRIRRRLAN